MKQPILLKVRDKEFRISFVSNFFSVNYYEMKQEMVKAQQAYYDMCAVQEKLKENKVSVDEATAVIENTKTTIQSIGKREFFERRMDLVKEACEINDIEYDRRFWERRTSPEDLVTFLDAVYIYGIRSAEEPHGEEKSKKASR